MLVMAEQDCQIHCLGGTSRVHKSCKTWMIEIKMDKREIAHCQLQANVICSSIPSLPASYLLSSLVSSLSSLFSVFRIFLSFLSESFLLFPGLFSLSAAAFFAAFLFLTSLFLFLSFSDVSTSRVARIRLRNVLRTPRVLRKIQKRPLLSRPSCYLSLLCRGITLIEKVISVSPTPRQVGVILVCYAGYISNLLESSRTCLK